MRLLLVATLLSMAALPLSGQVAAAPRRQWSEPQVRAIVTNSPWAREVTAGASGRRVTVRWESAAPVVEACAQGGMERYLFSCASRLLYVSGLANKFQEMARRYYVVSIGNYPKDLALGGGLHPPEHSAAAEAELARVAERIRESASLNAGKEPPSNPVDVVVLPAGDALLVLLFFPRPTPGKEPIGELRFVSSLGSIRVNAVFDAVTMHYRGKLAL